jgi:hypothetical protein
MPTFKASGAAVGKPPYGLDQEWSRGTGGDLVHFRNMCRQTRCSGCWSEFIFGIGFLRLGCGRRHEVARPQGSPGAMRGEGPGSRLAKEQAAVHGPRAVCFWTQAWTQTPQRLL